MRESIYQFDNYCLGWDVNEPAMTILCLGLDQSRLAALDGMIPEAGAGRYRLRPHPGGRERLDASELPLAEAVLLSPDGDGQAGLEAIAGLRKLAPHLPIVLLLAPGQESLVAPALALGAQDCLTWGLFDAPRLTRALDLARLRQASLEKLRVESDFFRSIVNDQTELICRLLPDGTVTFANLAYCRYFGASPDKVVGMNFFGFLAPEEGRQARRFLEGLTPEVPVGRSEQSYQTPGGETRWQAWTSRAFFNAQGRVLEYQGVGLDITERKLTEQTLQAVELNLRQIFLSNADGMIVADPKGKVLFVNPSAERMLSRDAADLVGSPFSFELTADTHSEMCLISRGGRKLVVAMRVVTTKWQGQPALLASLRDISELAELREELRSLSLEDELTGLYNRRGFITLARQQIKTALRMRRRMLLFFVDVDDLKMINDSLGHREGDRAVFGAAQVLRDTFRESDVVGRVGGDEFAALAMEADEEQAQPILERLRHSLESYNQGRPGSYRLSLSVGTATYDPAGPRPLEDLLAEADRKMYQQKRGKATRP